MSNEPFHIPAAEPMAQHDAVPKPGAPAWPASRSIGPDDNADAPRLSPAVDENARPALSASERLEQHMAEIDRACEILRRALPDLEAWPSQAMEPAASAKSRPVWLVIGIVWVSTLALTAMATFALAVLMS